MTVTEQERVSAPPKEREDAREEREWRASVLEAAALEIEVRGWAQGTACDATTGAVCARGAIGFATTGTPGTFTQHIQRLWGSACQLADWNDNRARSAADATFLLRWRAQEIRDGR